MVLNDGLTASSRLRKRKREQNICVHSGCWEKKAEGYSRCIPHINAHREEGNRDNLQARKDVLSHYGKNGRLQCCWDSCTTSDVDMLTLDHVNNDGFKEREAKKWIVGVRLYKILRRANYPNGYQTLCANHQLKKELSRRREGILGV